MNSENNQKTNNVESVSGNCPSPFVRSTIVNRSPTKEVGGALTPVALKAKVRTLLTAALEENQGEMSSFGYATKMLDALSEFLDSRSNIHREVKTIVPKVQKALLEANKEWKTREGALLKKAAEVMAKATPRVNAKRPRLSSDSPKLTPTPKIPRSGTQKQGKDGNEEWETVKRKKKKAEPKPGKKPQPRNTGKVRPKSDALVIGAKDPQSYADILRKVKSDPTLRKWVPK